MEEFSLSNSLFRSPYRKQNLPPPRSPRRSPNLTPIRSPSHSQTPSLSLYLSLTPNLNLSRNRIGSPNQPLSLGQNTNHVELLSYKSLCPG